MGVCNLVAVLFWEPRPHMSLGYGLLCLGYCAWVTVLGLLCFCRVCVGPGKECLLLCMCGVSDDRCIGFNFVVACCLLPVWWLHGWVVGGLFVP